MKKTICIAGKNDIAVDVMLHCANNYPDARIVVVCTQNCSRENSWQKSLMWFARKHNIEICELNDLYGIKDLIFLSAEFDRILRPERFATKQIYNIHFSMLPKYKGCHTSVLPILHNERETGVTFHRIDSGIDTGEIIEQKKIVIHPFDTSYDLYKKLIEAGTETVIKNLSGVIDKKIISYPQSSSDSTYYSLEEIDYKNLHLNINTTAYQIQTQIRAFCFRPYQLLEWNNSRLIECTILNDRSNKKPGTVLEETDTHIRTSTIDYDILIYKDVLSQLFETIEKGDNESTVKLCASSQIINAQNEQGWAPLTIATYNGNFEIVKYLISRGADIYIKDHNGTTLLMYAKEAGMKTGNWDIFRYYVDLGADLYEQDYEGKTVLDYLEDKKIRTPIANSLN